MEPLMSRLFSGSVDDILLRLYGTERLSAARTRYITLASTFQKTFGAEPTALFSAPGRTELGGNHTDHQHGCVLAAAVNLDALAAVRPNRSGMIRVYSKGYAPFIVDLHDLSPQSKERGTSAALVRGIAARMVQLEHSIQNVGADICITSEVPGGSGLSSSAVFEVLIGTTLNTLFCGGAFSHLEIAQIGQYAENVFFGKPCGLMDQTASSMGGAVAIDFADPAAPIVEQVPVDLQAYEYALCIIDSGAGHADLTSEYSAITDELKAVCRCFGKEFLREVPEAAFLSALPEVRRATGDRAVLRALHFYEENRRAVQEAAALRRGDFTAFLRLVHESGHSSAMYLQNIIPHSQTRQQELMLAIALCEKILGSSGAVRVHGGGFGGMVQTFVPLEQLASFKQQAEAVLGTGSCRCVSIRTVGGTRLA
ncbi:MAG: galactokinase [Oscillibacter sp.]|nr:galactokinase [Oscillibacter sp.]